MFQGKQLRIPRGRLSDEVVRHLTGMLADGSLVPGDELPSEAELCQSFNVSKSVIRVALKQLAAIGVVDIRQGKTSTVQELSADPLKLFFRLAVNMNGKGLEEALQVRNLLEPPIAAMAAQNISEKQLVELEGHLEDLKANAYNPDRGVTHDLAFHQLLAKATGNQLLNFLMVSLAGAVQNSIRRLSIPSEMRDIPGFLKRHQAIYDAVKSHEPAAAQQAMANHFTAPKDLLRRLMEQGIAP